ncbi:unnamed protein product [Vitrella brassicaformis CCMP3155]|uniref:Uncharacterized protein n=1 Tax=Vitrella brassicaformis (strain CCMP3155) TaxID=1169540 RepID=A0A0G4H8K2_VITBC|nr:unnamed protein product [Vitrella brassicaformis CCMP3155]|eukprot:CEM40106.1 unnamed protein product [Vitrella brassicaformis CCMP3155]
MPLRPDASRLPSSRRTFYSWVATFGKEPSRINVKMTLMSVLPENVEAPNNGEGVRRVIEAEKPDLVLLGLHSHDYDKLVASFNQAEIMAAGKAESLEKCLDRNEQYGWWTPAIQQCMVDSIPHFCTGRSAASCQLAIQENNLYDPRGVIVTGKMELGMVLANTPRMSPEAQKEYTPDYIRRKAPKLYAAIWGESCEYECIKVHAYVRHALLSGHLGDEVPKLADKFDERAVLKENSRVLVLTESDLFGLMVKSLPAYLDLVQFEYPNMTKIEFFESKERYRPQWFWVALYPAAYVLVLWLIWGFLKKQGSNLGEYVVKPLNKRLAALGRRRQLEEEPDLGNMLAPNSPAWEAMTPEERQLVELTGGLVSGGGRQ